MRCVCVDRVLVLNRDESRFLGFGEARCKAEHVENKCSPDKNNTINPKIRKHRGLGFWDVSITGHNTEQIHPTAMNLNRVITHYP